MRISLRARVLLLVFSINALLFAGGGLFVLRALDRENDRFEERENELLVHALRSTVRPENDVHTALILDWPGWGFIEDALLVDDNVATNLEGGAEFTGIAINPTGRSRRPRDFDQVEVRNSLRRAIQTGQPMADVAGGRVVPILGPAGIWGGCWYRRTSVDRTDTLLKILGWFVVSTLLLTAGTFYALRRLVLDPVGQLAEGARRVRSGDLEARLLEPPRRDEVSDLVRAFNLMTSEVRGFNARLEGEVERATKKALQAEQAAMTQRRLAAMGELAAGIAHEINNPLGGLQNAVERLESGTLPAEKQAEYLRLLQRGLERIGRTVSQLLRFTPRSLAHGQVDLRDVGQDAVDLVRHRAERLGIALALNDASGTAALVDGARNELGQAVLNLIVNALDALEEAGSADRAGPRVEVEVRSEPDAVVLEVRDNGPGVSEEELGRVADIFYSTKEVGRGSGLGLALVHNTVATHGGEVDLRSTAGRGFAALLRFPPSGAAAGADAAEEGEER
ncbi:MAG: HAMP domain-containing sensor histidine kinase [Planctomycetota bacterium]